MSTKLTTSSKRVTLDNKFIDELIAMKEIKYHHINLLTYLKDRATLEEGGLRFIKEITLNDINTFMTGDVKCRTTKKLLNDLIALDLIYVEDTKITPKKVLSITLDKKITQDNGSFTIVPEALIHSYPIGISTYIAIRKYHSEVAKISIPQIQKKSKVSKREAQYKIIKDLEALEFINIGVGGYNNANTYMCRDYSKIEFTRTYNKYTPKKKLVTSNIVKSVVIADKQEEKSVVGEWQ